MRRSLYESGKSLRTPFIQKEKFVVCRYCGHVNQDRLFCEKCSRPLSARAIKDWLLQKYFETIVLNAESVEEIVGASRDVNIGDVRADYVIEHRDGSKTVLMVTTQFEEVLGRLIKYNVNKKEKMKVVFLLVASRGVPKIKDETLREASLYNITVELFTA